MNIPVVYEDDWLLILDKPAGLLTIPTPRNEARTLTSIVNNDLIERGISYRLHPCHRLDKDTSGLIIYAKGKSVQAKMMREFKARAVKKTYLAFVQGRLAGRCAKITAPIDGQNARTEYRVISNKNSFTVVQVNPLTGRKNQIRLHFASIGYPLVGETKFALRRNASIKAKRLCLHAQSLEFFHPVKKTRLCVNSELPPYFGELLRSP